MSRVSRLAGALLVETEEAYFLVGNPKRPCDFAAAGFKPPGAIDAVVQPFIRLTQAGPVAVAGPWLVLSLEGEALLHALAERLLIERNASVSERLWRLIVSDDPDDDVADADTAIPHREAVIDARWLGDLPVHLWRIVRGAVLKCN